MKFTVLPAIDLMGGKAVSLERGDPNANKFTGEPVGIAGDFAHAGASWLHVVDLDAAFSKGENTGKIREIMGAGLSTEVGGGIRTKGRAAELLDAGAKRVVVGTRALEPEFMETLKEEVGKSRIVAAIDSRKERIVVKGWKEETGKDLYATAKELERYAGHFLFTPVEIEGMLKGPQTAQLKKLCSATKVPVIYSGGISGLQDIREVKKSGASGCIIGRALYEKRFELRDALKIEGEQDGS